jgi:hypothetical protein
MSINTSELTRLETLLTEILHAVVDHLLVWEIKNVSCASKRLRQACLLGKTDIPVGYGGLLRLK